MKKINFTEDGGFPLEQEVLDMLQSSYLDILQSYLGHIGVLEVGKYILTGCKIVGANITPGYMYIDGALCYFDGAVGTLATKIIKVVQTTSAAFENGTNPMVFTQTFAQVNAGGTALSEFVRFFPVSDSNYVHTDNNFTTALLTKLNGIQTAAQKNVQSDYNVANPLSDAFIKNMPEIVTPLYRGEATGLSMATGSTSTSIEIAFPSVGTAEYIVLGNLKGPGGSFQNAISFHLFSYTDTRFIISLKSDITLGYSNLTFQFVLMPKT